MDRYNSEYFKKLEEKKIKNALLKKKHDDDKQLKTQYLLAQSKKNNKLYNIPCQNCKECNNCIEINEEIIYENMKLREKYSEDVNDETND